MDWGQIRNQFPAAIQEVHGQPLVYLDSAASTLKAQPVIDCITQHYSKETANVHRGIHFLSSEATTRYEETRSKTKAFINAALEHEIIFTKGTTDSINLVAESWGRENLKAGDVILISQMEHHSNIVPWQIIAQKMGAVVQVIPINDAGELIIEEYKKLLTNKVKMVAVTHISNTLGTINPIKEMIELAHEAGSLITIDGAQSIAHMQVDVQDLDCDFFAFSGHKMFAPTGTGVLYGKEKHLNAMPPYQGGGAMIKEVTFEKTTFNDLPEKFEAGTPHIAGIIGLTPAFDYISNLGFENIQKWETELLEHATTELKKLDKIKVIGEAQKKTSVLSFHMEGVHPHDIGMILDQQGVAVRTGHHCTQPLMARYKIPATTRASFSIYNNHEDVEKFISSVKKAGEFLL